MARKAVAGLSLVLLAGAAFRLYGLTVGFPFEYHVDEWFITNKTLEMYRLGTWHPPAFDYPSLLYNLLLAAAHVVGLFREPTLYDIYVAGRVLSALTSTATVLVLYLLGRRAYAAPAGLLAAAFFACTVTSLREAHYCTTDSLNTLCITAAVYFIVRVALGDAPRNYLWAGAFVGLAAGSKYNGAFLCAPLVVAHMMRERAGAGAGASLASRVGEVCAALFSRRLITAGVVCVAVFLLTTPYAVLAPGEFARDVLKMRTALSQKVVEGNQHYIGTTPYWYYVENLLFWAMGPPLEVACIAGLLYALWRHRRQDVVIALWVLIYFYVVGGWLNKAVRYTLPMLPFLCLFGAAMFVEARAYFAGTKRRTLALASVPLASLTLASAFLYSLAYMNVYRQPHAGIQATRWAFENVPAGARVLLEGPTPHERPQVDGRQMVYQDPSFDFKAHPYRFVYLDVSKFAVAGSRDEEALRAELREVLSGADYIFMTTRWSEGLTNSPVASPVIRDYYRALLAGQTDFALVREIQVYPRLFGLDIRDDAAELNFRLFDHPKVLIFRRKEAAGAGAL